jgi:hypothetical protein
MRKRLTKCHRNGNVTQLAQKVNNTTCDQIRALI